MTNQSQTPEDEYSPAVRNALRRFKLALEVQTLQAEVKRKDDRINELTELVSKYRNELGREL